MLNMLEILNTRHSMHDTHTSKDDSAIIIDLTGVSGQLNTRL